MTWKQEITMLCTDFLLNKSECSKIISKAEKRFTPNMSDRQKYDVAQKILMSALDNKWGL